MIKIKTILIIEYQKSYLLPIFPVNRSTEWLAARYYIASLMLNEFCVYFILGLASKDRDISASINILRLGGFVLCEGKTYFF